MLLLNCFSDNTSDHKACDDGFDTDSSRMFSVVKSFISRETIRDDVVPLIMRNVSKTSLQILETFSARAGGPPPSRFLLAAMGGRAPWTRPSATPIVDDTEKNKNG